MGSRYFVRSGLVLEEGLGEDEIGGVGDFGVGLGVGDEEGRLPDGFEGGDFVGDEGVGGEDVLVGGGEQLARKNLWRFHEPEMLAAHACGGKSFGIGAFHGFGGGAGEGGGAVGLCGEDRGLDGVVRNERARAVVHGEERRLGGRGLDAVPDRVVALGAAVGARNGFGDALEIERIKAFWVAHDDERIDAWAGGEGVEAALQDRFSREGGLEFIEAHAAAFSRRDEDGAGVHGFVF